MCTKSEAMLTSKRPLSGNLREILIETIAVREKAYR